MKSASGQPLPTTGEVIAVSHINRPATHVVGTVTRITSDRVDGVTLTTRDGEEETLGLAWRDGTVVRTWRQAYVHVASRVVAGSGGPGVFLDSGHGDHEGLYTWPEIVEAARQWGTIVEEDENAGTILLEVVDPDDGELLTEELTAIKP